METKRRKEEGGKEEGVKGQKRGGLYRLFILDSLFETLCVIIKRGKTYEKEKE